MNSHQVVALESGIKTKELNLQTGAVETNWSASMKVQQLKMFLKMPERYFFKTVSFVTLGDQVLIVNAWVKAVARPLHNINY